MLAADALEREWFAAMRRGDYGSAWDVSAAMLARRDPKGCDDCAVPYHCRWVWNGAPLKGRDVLVRCYHGLGDTIQFLRYLPPLASQAASVTLEVQPPLLPLLLNFPGIDRLGFDRGAPMPARECVVEIMELCFALRLAPETLPPPYLSAMAASLPPGTIGLCWQAGGWDAQRSIPADLFAPFTRFACISLVPAPCVLPVLNPEGCPFDMVRTAGLIAGCRLVITVDTMVAHLAGALGKPVWLLLRRDADWRWAAGEETPWYPTMRLYRQEVAGDWHAPLARIRRDLVAEF
jgi:hypothetical protein